MNIALNGLLSCYLCTMLVKSRGIVLRNLKYGDTSLIVDIFSRELGMQSYILNGVRKPHSRMPASLFQVMSILDIVAYHQDKASLKRLKEASPAYYYQELPSDMRRSASGVFLVEVLRNTLTQTENNPDLYDFVENVFTRLDQRTEDLPVFVLRVLLLLTSYLGFQPGGQYSDASPFFDLMNGIYCGSPPSHPHYLLPELAMHLQPLQEPFDTAIIPPGLHSVQRRQLLTGLLDYYRLHLPHFQEPRSQAILHQVLAI